MNAETRGLTLRVDAARRVITRRDIRCLYLRNGQSVYHPASLKLQDRGGGRKSLELPAEVSKKVPPDARFECELVEDGILYRRVDEADRRERAA